MEKKLEIYKEKHKNLMDKVDDNLILIKENIIFLRLIVKSNWTNKKFHSSPTCNIIKSPQNNQLQEGASYGIL